MSIEVLSEPLRLRRGGVLPNLTELYSNQIRAVFRRDSTRRISDDSPS